jgi:Tfp pilus assembly protein PilV
VIVAISGLAQLFVASSAANLRARSRTLGTVLATAKMEELRAAADAPAAGLDYADARGNAFEQRTGSARGATFVRRWTVVAMPSNPGALVLEVEVRFPQASPGEVVRLTALKASRAP